MFNFSGLNGVVGVLILFKIILKAGFMLAPTGKQRDFGATRLEYGAGCAI